MRFSIVQLTLFGILTILTISCRDEGLDAYLKGNQLIAPLEVVELQGGVVGFTGTYYAIEANGDWLSGPVLPGKAGNGAPAAQGRLTNEQLVQLSKQLQKYDLANLSNHGASDVNPRVVKIRLGSNTSVLNPKLDKMSKDEDQQIRSRYAGILSAVKSLCSKP